MGVEKVFVLNRVGLTNFRLRSIFAFFFSFQFKTTFVIKQKKQTEYKKQSGIFKFTYNESRGFKEEKFTKKF